MNGEAQKEFVQESFVLSPKEPERALTLTVLHCGDVYLDAPVQRLRRDTKERRREELRRAFSSFLSRVDEEKADLVVFSGNLVDRIYANDGTLSFLVKAFEARPNCHFLIAPGPADAYGKDSIYVSKRLPRNVHIFAQEVLGTYNFPNLPLTVYGWGYLSDTCTYAPLTGARRQQTDRFTVLCGYSALEKDASLAPIEKEALASFGAHYVALSGGAHDGFHRAGNSVYAYSGVFEGRTFEDGQDGGYIRIRATQGEGGWAVEAERVALDTYRYVSDRLDVSHLKCAEDATEALLDLIREKGYDEKTVLHLVLYGSVPLSASFHGFDAEKQYGLYSLWVEDRTVPTDVDSTLLQQMNARGELYRHFYPMMTEGAEEDRARAARAFRIGYAALLDEDFTEY